MDMKSNHPSIPILGISLTNHRKQTDNEHINDIFKKTSCEIELRSY